MKIRKYEKGVTLIALVITIIVLLILAGVTILTLTGQNGILGKGNKAKEETNQKTATEILNLKITNVQISKYAEEQRMPTLKELSLSLKEDQEIAYITENSKIADIEYDVKSDNPTSIYTKLKEYPYEFEIDKKLKLASIDGVKIADNDVNSPTTGISEEDIRKIVTEELDKKIATIQTNEKYETIYEGKACESGKTYNLDKSLNDYKYIIVYAALENGQDFAITSRVIDKSCYFKNNDFPHLIDAHADIEYYYYLIYKFPTDKTFEITDETVVSWEGTPKIFLIKGVK